jgi:hypothetical protein
MYDGVDYRDRGILWLRYDDTTLDFIAKKGRPVFVFVGDRDPLIAPALSALLRAMPHDARLRELLHAEFPALFLEAGETPEYLAALGAGSAFHVAVLAPAGLTPLVTIDVIRDTDAVVAQIVQVLEALVGIWP